MLSFSLQLSDFASFDEITDILADNDISDYEISFDELADEIFLFFLNEFDAEEALNSLKKG